jgi:hypothetical protein
LQFRPYLAVVGCAAAIVLGTAVPAVAASAPSTTAVAPAPTRDSEPEIVKCASATTDAEAKAAAAKARPGSSAAEVCRQLLEKRDVLPAGAPETGGGGMAAEVGSWG